VFGRTASAQIWLERVELAKRMLVETDLKTAAIAPRSGFNSYQVFYNIFTRHTGVSPKAYRDRFRPLGPSEP